MGKPSQSTIEINGNRYDARTGRLLAAKAPKKPATPAASRTRRAPVMQDIARSAPRPSRSIHQKVQRSSTLMRNAVKKPAATLTPKPVKATSAARQASATARTPRSSIASKPLLQHDVQRYARAKKITQSSLVSKFGNVTSPAKPVKRAAQQTVSTQTVQSRAPAPAAKATPAAPKARSSAAQSVIEKGLRNATSHKQTYAPKKTSRRSKQSRRSKLATYGAGALAAVLLIGFIAYQNIPNIAVRYASTRAGVNASLPGYQPAGFALNSRVQYNPGQITLNFDSNSDNRSFSITQRETAWNSDALLSNYVSAKQGQVQKYEDKGRTIFLYGENNATWVSGGIWYDINGNSQLNSDQLIRIATSL